MNRALLILAALALQALLYLHGMSAPARLAAVVGALWLAPGCAWMRLRGVRPADFATGLAHAFGGSAASLALASALCFLLRLDPMRIADLVTVFLAASALAPAGRAEGAEPSRPRAGALSLAQLAGLAILAWVLYRTGGTVGQSFDSLDHLAYMKSVLRDHSALPAREFYREATSRALDLRKGFLHAPLAVTAALSGMDLQGWWRVWPAFVGPCVTACFYTLAASLLPGAGPAMLATALFALLYGGPGTAFFLKVGYPNKTADALVWLAWAAAAGNLRRVPRTSLLPAPAWLAGGALIHVFAAVPWMLAWSAFTVGCALAPRYRALAEHSLRVLGWALLACAPILAWRYLVSYAPVNPMHTQPGGYLDLGFGYVLEPMSWLATLGNATWLSVLVSPFYLASEPRPERLLACVALWAPLLLLFNPVLFPLLAGKLGYLLIRLFPAPLALCVLAGWSWEQGARLTGALAGSRPRALAALAVVTLFVGADVRTALAGYGPGAMRVERENSHQRWQAALDFLGSHYPEPRVIASDPMTCYGIAGLTRHDVVATLNQHSSPSDSEAVARMQAAFDIVSPGAGPRRTAEAIHRYGVDLVFLNQTYERPRLDYMAFLDPADYPAALEKFRSRPQLFHEVFGAGGQYVFEVNRTALPAYAAEPDPGWPDTAPAPGAVPVELGAGATLAGARLEPRETPAGSEVELTCLLRRRAELAPGERWMAQVSLVTAVPDPSRGLPPRWQRLLAQRRDHRLYRLNYYLPVGGSRGGPEYWPAGRWVAARFHLHIPGGAAGGTYVLRMRIEPQRFSPNVSARYYLEDDDHTPGGTLDTLRVNPYRPAPRGPEAPHV